MLKELFKGKTNIFGNLPEKYWRNIPAVMKRNRCAAARGIAKLLVRATLADFDKAKMSKNSDDFGGFEDRNIPHFLGDGNVLNANKFGLQHRLSIL